MITKRTGIAFLPIVSAISLFLASCGSIDIEIEYTPSEPGMTAVIAVTPIPPPKETAQPSPTPAMSATEEDVPGLEPYAETFSGLRILRLTHLKGTERIAWEDPQTLTLADDERGGFFSLSVSFRAPEPPRFEPYPDAVLSPDGSHVLRCGDGLVLSRTSDDVTIGSLDVSLAGGCPRFSPSAEPSVEPETLAYHSAPRALAWEPDGRTVAFISEDGGLYLWPSDAGSPRKADVAPVDFPLLSWSPVGTTLAFVRAYDPQTRHVAISAISSLEGQLWNEEFELEGDPQSVSLAWIGYHAILVRSSNSWSVLDAHTGKRLTYWTGDSRIPWFQMPMASSDGRWLAIEVTKPNEASSEYKLVDLKTLAAMSLGQTAGNYVEFAGWRADSALMYFVSYPANQFSISDPKTPFGLLAANPQAKSIVEVFGGTLAVSLSPDRRWAFVLLPDRRDDGTLRMTAALWEIGSVARPARREVSEDILYPDGRWSDGTAVGTQPFLKSSWSHDSSHVIFENHHGSLFIASIDGTVETVAAGLVEPWVERSAAAPVRFTWSPDDRLVLVECEGGAWILPMDSSSPDLPEP